MSNWKIRLQNRLQKPNIAPFVPRLLTCLLSGYSQKDFNADLVAGITVGIISLPLAMAFALGAGVDPERGLYTGIVAGFLIAFFGGSRFQVSGPTGAFVILLFGIVQKHGYEGLATATFVASLLLMILGLLRCGILIRYIPHPVIVGFSAGIAAVIIINQVKDFCGLTITHPSADAISRLQQYGASLGTFDFVAFFVASATLLIIIRLRMISKRIPAPIVALVCITTVTWLFALPISTIASHYGVIPSSLPAPAFPDLSFDLIRKTFPDAIAIALLCAIESLLSCVIADSLSGTKHLSNCELIAQGIGNLGSSLFGGIPATGAIARTTANVQMNAQTPMSAIIHAVTLLIMMILFAPFASLMPLPALAAILAFVGWNMFEFHHIKNIFKGPTSDTIAMAATFFVTICVDLIAAVQTGVLLSIIIFLKKMRDSTTGTVWTLLQKEESLPIKEEKRIQDLPDGIEVFEIEGPFFFAVSDLLNELFARLDTGLDKKPRAIIVRLRSVPLIDSSGLHALERFSKRMENLKIKFFLCEAKPAVLRTLNGLQLHSTESFAETLEHCKSLFHQLNTQ